MEGGARDKMAAKTAASLVPASPPSVVVSLRAAPIRSCSGLVDSSRFVPRQTTSGATTGTELASPPSGPLMDVGARDKLATKTAAKVLVVRSKKYSSFAQARPGFHW